MLTQSTNVTIEGCPAAAIAVQGAKVTTQTTKQPTKQPKLTRSQQLAAALKACRKRDSAKNKHHARQLCEAQARRRYGPPKKKTTTKAANKK